MDCHKLRILSLFQAEICIESPPKDFPFTHVISIGNNETAPPEGLAKFHHLRLCYDDLTSRTLHKAKRWERPPAVEHVERSLNFAKNISTPILIHCTAGISRSSATALALIIDRLGPGSEDEAFDQLFRIKLGIRPNDLLVQHADEIVGCNGELVEAYYHYFPRAKTGT